MIVADLAVSTCEIIELKDMRVVRDYICRKQCMCVDRGRGMAGYEQCGGVQGGGECRRRTSSRPYSGDVVDKIVPGKRCLPASGECL